ncbi:hypothetical protein [Neobacillus sp. Marseille-QA0830]
MATDQYQALIKYIPPISDYEAFRDEDHYKEKLKEWGLSAAKKEFLYKDRHFQCPVTVKGYETYGSTGEFNTLVIEFPDGNVSCIHPAYLKEMQSSSFGKESLIEMEDKVAPAASEADTVEPKAKVQPPKAAAEPVKAEKPKKETKPKKEKAPKLELPGDKVHFTASVKQFALTYNPFNEANDEVVVLENVQIVQESPLDVGLAWCSHSKTLKKFELAPGDLLEFDGKITSKKLAKGKEAPDEFVIVEPVLYKINNPSKIEKK